jgi:hypothetical protein
MPMGISLLSAMLYTSTRLGSFLALSFSELSSILYLSALTGRYLALSFSALSAILYLSARKDRYLALGISALPAIFYLSARTDRVSTEVTFWHSAEYGSDFRCNSGEIPRNSAKFRGISPELRRNHFRSQKIPRNSVSAEFRGHPTYR